MKKYIFILPPLLLTCIFYVISISANSIFFNIIQTDNIFFSIMSITSCLFFTSIPIIFYIFFVTTTNLILNIFDVKNVDSYNIKNAVSFSFIFPIISNFAYCVNFYIFDKTDITNTNQMENMIFACGLTIKEFGHLNDFFWLLMYLSIFCILYLKYNVSIFISLLSTFLPTVIVFLFTVIIKF